MWIPFYFILVRNMYRSESGVGCREGGNNNTQYHTQNRLATGSSTFQMNGSAIKILGVDSALEIWKST